MRDSGRGNRPRDPRRSQNTPGSSARRPRTGTPASARTGRPSKASAGKARPRAKAAGSADQRRLNNPRPRSTRELRRQRDRQRTQYGNKTPLLQRKSVQLLILLLVIVLFGAVAVYFVTHRIENQAAAPNPAKEFEAVACTPDMLDIQLAKTTGNAGQPINFELTIANSDKNPPCYINVGYENLWLEITSGDQPVYNAKVCKDGSANKQLLLDKGMETAQKLQWGGYNSGADCKGTELAQPGTYVANLLLNGKDALSRSTVFELN